MRSTCFLLLLTAFGLSAQLPKERLNHWDKSGLQAAIYNLSEIVSIEDFGGGTSTQHNNDSALDAAISFLSQNNGGTILFGQGKYRFYQPIHLKDSISIGGEGPATVFEFDLGHQSVNCINIGGQLRNPSYSVQGWNKNDAKIRASYQVPAGIQYVRLSYNDSSLCFSSWAYGEIGQIVKVISQDTLTNQMELHSPLRLAVSQQLNPVFQIIDPIQNASISCLKIQRMDSTSSQTSHIVFNYAVNCMVKGVEFEMGNFAHILFQRSAYNFVTGCYMHDAFNFGGGGKAYGVVLQSASSDNLIENNVFKKLRHSILLQSGANGNVIAYNYSTEPYGSEMIFKDISGDMVCHGNYPHNNLFEGNICQNIVVDNSHGKNGPFNTFFRNRASLYGVLISVGQDSQNFICNEITDSGFLKGQFLQNGSGHYYLKNNVRGILSGNLQVNIFDSSLYRKMAADFWSNGKFGGIGFPFVYSKGSIPAEKRFLDSSIKTSCRKETYTFIQTPEYNSESNALLAPNPAGADNVCLKNYSEIPSEIHIYNSEMRLLNIVKDSLCIDVSNLTNGLYYVLIENNSFVMIVDH